MEAGNEMVVAYCGLACSNCGMYQKGKCKGCHSAKPMNSRCSIKACAMERKFDTCADCGDFQDLHDCKKLHNLVSRFFGLIFRSDRIGNLDEIREIGFEKFKQERAVSGKK